MCTWFLSELPRSSGLCPSRPALGEAFRSIASFHGRWVQDLEAQSPVFFWVLFAGVPAIGGLLVGVYSTAPDFYKLPYRIGPWYGPTKKRVPGAKKVLGNHLSLPEPPRTSKKRLTKKQSSNHETLMYWP